MHDSLGIVGERDLHIDAAQVLDRCFGDLHTALPHASRELDLLVTVAELGPGPVATLSSVILLVAIQLASVFCSVYTDAAA